jgi:hypothetical protein
MGYQYQVRNTDEAGCDWSKQQPNKFYKDNIQRLIPQGMQALKWFLRNLPMPSSQTWSTKGICTGFFAVQFIFKLLSIHS